MGLEAGFWVRALYGGIGGEMTGNNVDNPRPVLVLLVIFGHNILLPSR